MSYQGKIADNALYIKISGEWVGKTLGAPNGIATLDGSGTVNSASLPDSTSTIKGVLKLIGDLGGTANSPSVTKIQGHSVNSITPIDGYVLTWDNTDGYWLPRLPPTGFSAGGDLTGSNTNQNVVNIHGASVPIAGSLIIGNVLQVTGSSTLSYGAVNLAGGSNYVTGILPTSNQASQSMAGDVTGTTSAATVTKLQGKSVSSTAPNDGYVLTWVAGNNDWEPKGATGNVSSATSVSLGIIQLSGDLNGNGTTATSPRVSGINGATIPVGGSLITGNILQVSGASALSYGALNLAGGANYVTGLLPNSNQVAQNITGDVIGTTASSTVIKLQGHSISSVIPTDGYVLTWDNTDGYWLPSLPQAGFSAGGDLNGTSSLQNVVKIHGASVPIAGSLTTGNVLQVTGSSTLSYGAINLAGGSNYVTGVLPTGNQASQIMGGDVTGTTSAATVTKLQGFPINSVTPADGYVLTWDQADGYWLPKLKQSALVIANNYTIVYTNGDIYADLSSSSFTITLPISPFLGEKHNFKDYNGDAATNNLTINGNGKNIEGFTGGTASTLVLNQNGDSVELGYNGIFWNIL